MNLEHREIPQALHNEEGDGELHSHCRVCDCYLLEDETEYYLEKVVRRVPELQTQQTLFEFAVCANCLQELRKALSKESKRAMEQFFQQKMQAVFFNQPHTNLYEAFENGRCLFTGKKTDEFETFQMAAYCKGRHLHSQQPPIIISDETIEESTELLSAQTRDELNNFVNSNFGWPPEFAKLLTDGDLALL